MNKTVCQRRCVFRFVAMSALGLALIGCKADRAAVPAGAPRVENLRQQALADQVASRRLFQCCERNQIGRGFIVSCAGSWTTNCRSLS